MQIGCPADLSCASCFCRGFFERASQPYEKRAASLPRPCGQCSTKSAMLGRYVRDLKACLWHFSLRGFLQGKINY
jgi:hypothetical protein